MSRHKIFARITCILDSKSSCDGIFIHLPVTQLELHPQFSWPMVRKIQGMKAGIVRILQIHQTGIGFIDEHGERWSIISSDEPQFTELLLAHLFKTLAQVFRC